MAHLALANLAGPFGPGHFGPGLLGRPVWPARLALALLAYPFGRPIWPWPIWPAHLALAHLAGPFGPGPCPFGNFLRVDFFPRCIFRTHFSGCHFPGAIFLKCFQKRNFQNPLPLGPWAHESSMGPLGPWAQYGPLGP